MLLTYCFILSLFVIWTAINVLFLPNLKSSKAYKPDKVSILIPMRNEERNVRNSIRMLKQLTYPQLEIIIYNDQSTDLTSQLLQEEIAGDLRFQVVTGKRLPEKWVGKVHACYQLQRHATGQYLAFVDADVTLSNDIFEKVVGLMQRKNIGLITGFPRFLYKNWLDRLVIPMMHFFVNFHLPIALANYSTWSAATAANGTFLFFRRDAYDQMGGHEVVRDSLLEDVEIARAMKKTDTPVLLINISKDVSCTMYSTSAETWQGFSKNSFKGLNYSIVSAFLFSIFYMIFYVLPVAFIVYACISNNWLFAVPYGLIVVQRAISDYKSGTRIAYALFMPFSTIATLAILWNSIYLYLAKQPYTWKGRDYS